GDHESLAAIRLRFGHRVCARPLALEARSPGQQVHLGQVVHASPERGLRCLHREQPPGTTCANYHVRFLCPLEPTWTEWGAWGPCSRSCGGSGTRVRRRSCKPAKRNPPCPGRATEGQKCHPSPCPGNPPAVPECTWRATPGGSWWPAAPTLAGSRPLSQPVSHPGRVLVASSDAQGRFTATGLCPDPSANLSAHRDGFAPGLSPIVTNGSGVAVAHLKLRRLEKPYMVLHPTAKVREAGQDVTFCCQASGVPEPQNYSWYHNGTLLEGTAQSQLELRGLAQEQAGTYHCRATSEAGAILSEPAQLTVLGEPPPGAAGGEMGIMNPGDSNRSCLLFMLHGRCGFEVCCSPGNLWGRVTAADTGEPLRFGLIFLGGRKVGFTGYQGSFTIEVPPDTRRLVTRFVDGQQRLVDAVKVLPFDPRGGAVYQEVKMMRKKEPVELDGGQSNSIPLGEAGGREPVGELVLPAGVFLRPSGEVFNGTVKASVTFVDPRDVGTASAASSDLSFANARGEIVPLRTYGMFAVDFREGDSGRELQAGPVQVRMDAGQVRMPEHLHKMKLWSLNPESGLWEEEGVLRPAGRKRKRREERTFLVGNLEIRERRLFNLDVPEDRRCFVKVRAYSNEKFNPYEQLEGVVISLINLEPQPGFPSNPRAWGRFDSVVTGPNGACLPAFCDARRPDAYTALVTATLGGEELEAVASSPKLNPNAVGVAQPYLGKLGYRRSDHEDAALKKTAFQINVAKPDPNNVDENNGPVYSYRSLRECEEAPVSANHLRFYRVEVDKYEYNVVPFKESDVTTWTGDYL
ncbi:CILP2 protein, partial [Pomatorhinus ruficollis]|nr:CILP2 protein [Pomatorhinus ruficollis]